MASSAWSCSWPTVRSWVLFCRASHKPARVASQSEAQTVAMTQPGTAAARAVLQYSAGQQCKHCLRIWGISKNGSMSTSQKMKRDKLTKDMSSGKFAEKEMTAK